MITLLIPLAQNRVRFSAASGRRFHVVDQMLMDAIEDAEATTVAKMQEVFRLPRRMVVEVVVTLLEDNAIQLRPGSGDTFELTDAAVEARKSGRQPTRTGFRVEEKSTTVVMERLTGGLIHRNDISLSSRGELLKTGVWDKACRLPSEYEDDTADEGEVRPFIRPGRDHWLYRILQVEMAGDGSYWLPVDVNPETGEVIGLPYSWQNRLRFELLDFASRAPREFFSSWQFWNKRQTAREPKERSGWVTDVQPQDLTFSAEQHIELLRKTLQEAPADSVIFISSPVYHPNWLNSGMRETIREAGARGVHTDLLWGGMAAGAGAGGTPLDQLRKLDAELRTAGAPGSIRFNTRPHSSRASLLVAAYPDEAFASVSSYPWLSGLVDGEYCGARVSSPGAIAEICWSVAAFLIEAGQKLMTSPYRWRTVAGRLEHAMSESQGHGNSFLTVFRGHGTAFEDIVASSEAETLIASRQLSDIQLRKLLSKISSDLGKVRIFAGTSLPNTDGRVHVLNGLAVEAVASGTSCAIFSSSMLEESPAGRPMSVNLLIDGGPVPNIVRSRYCS